MVFYPTAVSGTDGDDDDYDFEKSFTSSFCTDDQFEAAFHRSDHLFSRACSVVEEADGWDWQAAASWTVTAMVDTLNWEGSDVDGLSDTHDNSQQRRQSPHNQWYFIQQPSAALMATMTNMILRMADANFVHIGVIRQPRRLTPDNIDSPSSSHLVLLLCRL